MIILIGSIALDTANLESDLDILIDHATAKSLPEDIWTLCGGKVDGYYIETFELGWNWSNSISNPEYDNPLKPSEHLIWFEAGVFTGARIITIDELLEMVDELKAGEVPKARGLTWAPKDRSALSIRAKRDQEMLELSENGLSQREIARMYGLNQSQVSRGIRRARVQLAREAY